MLHLELDGAKAAHFASVKGEVEFLRGLRDKLAADPERTVSEIVKCDQCIEQYLVQGVPKSHGDKLLAEIKQNEAKRLADKRKFLNDQRLVFEQELAKLDAAIEGKPAEPVAKIPVPQGATLAERSEVVLQHLKETANTVRLVDFFHAQDSPEALQRIVDEFSEVVEPESSTVIAGDE